MKRILCVLLIISIFTLKIFAQTEIKTASSFFQSVSEYYGTIKDYEADVDITAGSTHMTGKVSFKRPNLLRIDFSNPDTQVIVFNGNQLTIYLPKSAAILSQTVSNESDTNGANLATPQGLSLMNRYYTISYETSPDPVFIDTITAEDGSVMGGSGEKVIKLLLTRKNATEGFRTIVLSIDPTSKLIRRVQAESSTTNEVFVFNFSGYALNQSIPDVRFLYDTPASANTYNNFLFSE